MAVYAGVVAGGVAQEAAKFFAVKDREERAALWIGYGFAIIDIAVLIAEVAVALITSPNVSLQVVPMVGLILNPVVSAMFHPGTAMFLRLMQGRGGGGGAVGGLLATTLAHAYIDSLAAYINYAAALAVIGGGTGMYDLVGLLWSSSIAISAAFLFVGGVRGGLGGDCPAPPGIDCGGILKVFTAAFQSHSWPLACDLLGWQPPRWLGSSYWPA